MVSKKIRFPIFYDLYLGICYYYANNLLCHDLTFLFWILETVFNHLKLLHFLFANEISMAQGSVQEVRKTNENNFGNFIW